MGSTYDPDIVIVHTVCDTNSCAFKQYELRHFMAGWWNVPMCNHLAVTFPIYVFRRTARYALMTRLVRAERWSISIPMTWLLKWSTTATCVNTRFPSCSITAISILKSTSFSKVIFFICSMTRRLQK